ncbi:MAG: hypothetical protein AB1589_10315 [Cyanobacteriota bacterium]
MDNTLSDSMFARVSEVLDQALEGYPQYPYRKAFNNPELRRTLVINVLNQIPNWYPREQEEQKASIQSENLSLSQDQQLHLKNLVRQEIAYIIQQSSECISRTRPEEADSCFTPSHWFG